MGRSREKLFIKKFILEEKFLKWEAMQVVQIGPSAQTEQLAIKEQGTQCFSGKALT